MPLLPFITRLLHLLARLIPLPLRLAPLAPRRLPFVLSRPPLVLSRPPLVLSLPRFVVSLSNQEPPTHPTPATRLPRVIPAESRPRAQSRAGIQPSSTAFKPTPKSTPPRPTRHSGVFSRNPVFVPRPASSPRKCTPRRPKSFLEKTLIARETPISAPHASRHPACARLPRRSPPRGLAITTSVVATLAGLVAINSVNASLEGGPGEAELANHVADLARAAGADVEMYDVEPGRPNLLAWIRRGNRPTLMFECHLDTVGLEPMPDALNPRIANGRLYGRGSADPKGCMAAMLHVLRTAAADPAFPVDLCLAGAMGEEIVMSGSRVMAERRPPVDAAVVGEPTELQIITAQKGAVRWRVRTHGVAAHSAMPEQGHNAIEDMAKTLPALARGLEPHLTARTHPVLGNATWNVGTIRGGAGVNVVPDRCEIEIDRRLVPGDTSAEVLEPVDAALDDLRASDPELRIDRDPPFVNIPPLETPADEPIVRAAQRAVAAAGLSPGPMGVAYATDAAMLSGVGGIPSVVLGPGDIAQAHTNDEWIEIAQLEQAVGIYLDVCRAFAELA